MRGRDRWFRQPDFKKGMPLEDARVKKCIEAGTARLNGSGRILVRSHGTAQLGQSSPTVITDPSIP